jgi:hypothetical protein
MTASSGHDSTNEQRPRDYPVDWRTRVVTHTTSDIPAAYPGGPSHKAGALVTQETTARDAKGRNVGFPTPSAVALALNVATKAAIQARELQDQIVDSPVVSPFGPSTSVTHESTPALFDYLEACMTVLTFCFQALEAYSNEVISTKVTGTYAHAYRKGTRHVGADQLERDASTEEKLGAILPDLLGVPTPKGTKVWNSFVELKRARDATIHIKSRDSMPRIMQPSDFDDRTLFHRFLGANPLEWVKAAVTMIDYFASNGDVPLWLEHVKTNLGVRTTKANKNQTKQTALPRSERRT